MLKSPVKIEYLSIATKRSGKKLVYFFSLMQLRRARVRASFRRFNQCEQIRRQIYFKTFTLEIIEMFCVCALSVSVLPYTISYDESFINYLVFHFATPFHQMHSQELVKIKIKQDEHEFPR